MNIKLVDVGYVIKSDEVKNGYMYIVDGKNAVYRVFSKKFYEVGSFVFVYFGNERVFISDR